MEEKPRMEVGSRVTVECLAPDAEAVDAAVSFYRDFLGFSVIRESAPRYGTRIIWLEAPGGHQFNLALIQPITDTSTFVTESNKSAIEISFYRPDLLNEKLVAAGFLTQFWEYPGGSCVTFVDPIGNNVRCRFDYEQL